MFATDYNAAREALYAAAPLAGGQCLGLPLPETGPDGNPLAIDIAWFGSAAPRRVLLHAAGLHGVEGFTGSAIQLGLLRAGLPPLPPDAALLLVHVLDPYGMAWLRRCDAAGVDLDHNLLPPGAEHTGTPAAYAACADALRADAPPETSFLGLRAGMFGLQHGAAALWAAVEAGQHDDPRGLAWGGDAPRPALTRLQEWVRAALHNIEHLVAVDVRTGPGPDAIFSDAALPAARPLDLPGHYHRLFPRLLPEARVDVIVQHFHTTTPARAAHALREENRWHHHGDGGIDHPTRAALKAAFMPTRARQQRAVIARGGELIAEAAALLGE